MSPTASAKVQHEQGEEAGPGLPKLRLGKKGPPFHSSHPYPDSLSSEIGPRNESPTIETPEPQAYFQMGSLVPKLEDLRPGILGQARVAWTSGPGRSLEGDRNTDLTRRFHARALPQ